MYEASRLHPALGRIPAHLRDALARPCGRDGGALRPLGHDAADRILGGGLRTGVLHEIFARGKSGEASAMGFALMLALRLMDRGSQAMLWLREERSQRRAGINAPGLVDLGFDPARIILGVLPDAKSLLRASVDALRCVDALGVVLLELDGNPALMDLTASRRLVLAAEASGVTLLLLRMGQAKPAPSAARTRWQVGPAPSARLEADAPGHPALSVTLLRQRGGPADLDWTLEWDRDAGLFRPAALPGARLPMAGGGSRPAAGEGERWRLAG